MSRLEDAKNAPRSVSQYKRYKDCPYSYYLERVRGAWQRPAAWLVQGTAFHEAIELYERSGATMPTEEVVAAYEAAYERDANRYLEKTPNAEYWHSSGPYHGPADLGRRFGLGRDQVLDYISWREKNPIEIAVMPDGTPGIELEFLVNLGGVDVRGFIDQVTTERVRDLKTGNQPGDVFQLAVYRLALFLTHKVDVAQGDYWMGSKNGKHRGPTAPFDLDVLTEEYVTGEFQWLDEQIKAENFEPKPSAEACRFCSVASSCEYRM